MLSATGDGKWVSYVYTNAAAGGVGSERFGASQLKNARVVRHDGLLFGSGWYINAGSVAGEWFAFIADPSGTIVADYDPGLLGRHLGYLFGADAFTATDDGSWVTTHGTDAAGGEPAGKLHAWVVEQDGFVFGSGWRHGRPD